MDSAGFEEFPTANYYVEPAQIYDVINASLPDSGFFAESWSSTLYQTMTVTDELGSGYDAATTATSWSKSALESDLGQKLRSVSRLQQSAVAQGVTRDFYFVASLG